MGAWQAVLDAGGRLYCWGNREPILTIRRVLWVRPPAHLPCMQAALRRQRCSRCLHTAAGQCTGVALPWRHAQTLAPTKDAPCLFAGTVLWLGAGSLLLDLRAGHAAVNRVCAVFVPGRCREGCLPRQRASCGDCAQWAASQTAALEATVWARVSCARLLRLPGSRPPCLHLCAVCSPGCTTQQRPCPRHHAGSAPGCAGTGWRHHA